MNRETIANFATEVVMWLGIFAIACSALLATVAMGIGFWFLAMELVTRW